MTYFVDVNAMGSYSIMNDSVNPPYCVATVYSEGMATRICRLLNQDGGSQ